MRTRQPWRALAGTAIACTVALASATAQQHPKASFLGGSSHDRAQGCANVPGGLVVITGNTGSDNFSSTMPPAAGGYQKTFQGTSDAFVVVINPQLSSVVAWTYLGGSLDERGYGVVADTQARIWVVGFTESSDFPTTDGTHGHGKKDCFVARFSPDLKQLQMCTVLGGSGDDNPRGSFTVDGQHNAYLGGNTESPNFPTTNGVFQENHAGAPGTRDGFVTKVDQLGHIVWSTMLGGNEEDTTAGGVRLASDGTVIVAGTTRSANFPVTSGALQPTYGGDSGTNPFSGDGFVTRLSADAQHLVFSTYIGGSDDDVISPNDGLVVDAADNVIIIGQTMSQDFPMAPGGWSTTRVPSPFFDGFAAIVSADGTHLLHSTFFGGTEFEEPSGIGRDQNGNIYLSGTTTSGNFPVTLDAKYPQYQGGGDAYIVKFSADLSDLLYSTFLGGTGNSGYGDRGRTVAVSSQDQVLVSGDTDSPDFPTTTPVFDHEYDGGSSDGFVTAVSLSETYAIGQGKTTSQGKHATMTWLGTPSVAGAQFEIEIHDAIPNKRGLLVWGEAIDPKPFQGGTLYVQTPLHRVSTKTADATGYTKYSINLATGMIGTTRVYQHLFEDPGQTDGSGVAMSNALKVVFTP